MGPGGARSSRLPRRLCGLRWSRPGNGPRRRNAPRGDRRPCPSPHHPTACRRRLRWPSPLPAFNLAAEPLDGNALLDAGGQVSEYQLVLADTRRAEHDSPANPGSLRVVERAFQVPLNDVPRGRVPLLPKDTGDAQGVAFVRVEVDDEESRAGHDGGTPPGSHGQQDLVQLERESGSGAGVAEAADQVVVSAAARDLRAQAMGERDEGDAGVVLEGASLAEIDDHVIRETVVFQDLVDPGQVVQGLLGA